MLDKSDDFRYNHVHLVRDDGEKRTLTSVGIVVNEEDAGGQLLAEYDQTKRSCWRKVTAWEKVIMVERRQCR